MTCCRCHYFPSSVLRVFLEEVAKNRFDFPLESLRWVGSPQDDQQHFPWTFDDGSEGGGEEEDAFQVLVGAYAVGVGDLVLSSSYDVGGGDAYRVEVHVAFQELRGGDVRSVGGEDLLDPFAAELAS